jgi:hypothetical protein
MIRTALAYLAAGIFAGALVLARHSIPRSDWTSRLLPLHVEFLLVGWTVQLVLGVAFWILPRFRHGPARRGEAAAWLAYGLLNVGVLTTVAGRMAAWPDGAAFVGRALEGLAAAAFAGHAWARVRPGGAGQAHARTAR